MVSAGGKKEDGRQVKPVGQSSCFILAQFAQQLAELGRGMVAQLGLLGLNLAKAEISAK